MTRCFTHLHIHSEFSLLDSTCRIKDMIEFGKTHKLSHLALTDNGVMFGAIDFYLACKDAGIEPVLGCELYVVDDLSQKTKPLMRLIALCQNNTGYTNLCQLVSESHTKHFYYRPRVDLNLIKQFQEGLLFISPGQNGPIAFAMQNNNPDLATHYIQNLKEIARSRFYLGLQSPFEGLPNNWDEMAYLAKEHDLPLVATNDVYYTKPTDHTLRRISQCIQFGRVLEEDELLDTSEKPQYLASPQEMEAMYAHYPEAIENTLKIAKSCKVELELDRVSLPHFACPDGLSSDQYLEKLVWEGIFERYNIKSRDEKPELKARVEFELDTMVSMQFSIYFLIIYDFLAYCREQNIPIGPGRGSAAGSIVAYALGITNVDPLPYNLLFERFLNTERVSMPDIDLDFCIKRRQEVIDYIGEKYGAAHVAQIITFGTMQARAVVRDVGRVLNIPLADVDRIAKLIPASPGHYTPIKEALEEVPELKEAYETNPKTQQWLDFAMKLEGLQRHSSTHAAGVVISQAPLSTVVPLSQNDGQVCTQYSMGILEKLGLLKMDILGLRNLTVLESCKKLILKNHQTTLNLDTLPLDDKATYDTLCSGATFGVFQLESPGMQKLIKDLKPTCFEDLIALLALYRPGPLGSGMVDTFISNKAGTTQVSYQLDCLEPILSDTYGLILYQEQVMQIASAVGGFSLAQADMLRRAMGKKKKSVMDAMKEDFLEGAKQKGYPLDTSGQIFELCYKFSEYGFNKSHSTAYALISFQTAYLKTHYPTEYFTALLSSVSSNSDKVAEYIHDVKAMGITILPPCVQDPHLDFTCKDTTIRFGLSAIKNVGEGAIESIVLKRQQEGSFNTFEDFLLRVDLRQVNKRVIENLIYAGAFDTFKQERSYLLNHYERLLEQAQSEVKKRASGQESLFDAMGVSPFQVLSDPETQLSFSELQLLGFEKEALGLFFSMHPLELLNPGKLKAHAPISSLSPNQDGERVQFIALVTSIRKTKTKTNKWMIIASLEDLTGKTDAFAFFEEDQDPLVHILKTDHIVHITARLQAQDTRIRLVIQDARQIDIYDAQEQVHIDLETLEDHLIDPIRATLLSTEGNMPVYLHLGQHVIRTGQKYWISKDSLAHLQQQYGKERIWLGVSQEKETQNAS